MNNKARIPQGPPERKAHVQVDGRLGRRKLHPMGRFLDRTLFAGDNVADNGSVVTPEVDIFANGATAIFFWLTGSAGTYSITSLKLGEDVVLDSGTLADEASDPINNKKIVVIPYDVKSIKLTIGADLGGGGGVAKAVLQEWVG